MKNFHLKENAHDGGFLSFSGTDFGCLGGFKQGPHESRRGEASVCPAGSVPGHPHGLPPLPGCLRKKHPSGKFVECFPGGRGSPELARQRMGPRARQASSWEKGLSLLLMPLPKDPVMAEENREPMTGRRGDLPVPLSALWHWDDLEWGKMHMPTALCTSCYSRLQNIKIGIITIKHPQRVDLHFNCNDGGQPEKLWESTRPATRWLWVEWADKWTDVNSYCFLFLNNGNIWFISKGSFIASISASLQGSVCDMVNRTGNSNYFCSCCVFARLEGTLSRNTQGVLWAPFIE